MKDKPKNRNVQLIKIPPTFEPDQTQSKRRGGRVAMVGSVQTFYLICFKMLSL